MYVKIFTNDKFRRIPDKYLVLIASALIAKLAGSQLTQFYKFIFPKPPRP
jgi:hypothetical protein